MPSMQPNTIRVKVLKPAFGKFRTLSEAEQFVNTWIKSRKHSRVLGVSLKGNSTKGYEAVVTYNIV